MPTREYSSDFAPNHQPNDVLAATLLIPLVIVAVFLIVRLFRKKP